MTAHVLSVAQTACNAPFMMLATNTYTLLALDTAVKVPLRCMHLSAVTPGLPLDEEVPLMMPSGIDLSFLSHICRKVFAIEECRYVQNILLPSPDGSSALSA